MENFLKETNVCQQKEENNEIRYGIFDQTKSWFL